MKKFLALLLTVCLMVTSVFTGSVYALYDVDVDMDMGMGMDTEEEIADYRIDAPEMLYDLAKKLNAQLE